MRRRRVGTQAIAEAPRQIGEGDRLGRPVAALDRVGRGLHVERVDDAVAGVGVEEDAAVLVDLGRTESGRAADVAADRRRLGGASAVRRQT